MGSSMTWQKQEQNEEFQSNFGMQQPTVASGFQPMQYNFNQSVIPDDGEDLDLEERERIARVEKEHQDKMRSLYEKSEEESQTKLSLKAEGTKWIQNWK